MVECAADDFHPVSYGPLRADGAPVDTLLTEQPELGCQAFVDCALPSPRHAIPKVRAFVAVWL